MYYLLFLSSDADDVHHIAFKAGFSMVFIHKDHHNINIKMIQLKKIIY